MESDEQRGFTKYEYSNHLADQHEEEDLSPAIDDSESLEEGDEEDLQDDEDLEEGEIRGEDGSLMGNDHDHVSQNNAQYYHLDGSNDQGYGQNIHNYQKPQQEELNASSNHSVKISLSNLSPQQP